MMLTKLYKRKFTLTPSPSAPHLWSRAKVPPPAESFSLGNASVISSAYFKKRERSVFDEAMADLLMFSSVIRTSLKKTAFLYLSVTLWCQLGDGTM
jgi:hypothetical protein